MARILASYVVLIALTVLGVTALSDTHAATTFTIVDGDCRGAMESCGKGTALTLKANTNDVMPFYKAATSDAVLNTIYGITLHVSQDTENDNTVSGRIAFPDDLPDGEYEISLPTLTADNTYTDTRVPAGYLLIRSEYVEQGSKKWRPPGSSPSPMFIAGGASSYTVISGDKWTVYGNFNTTATTYEVIIYNVKGVTADWQATPDKPSCENVVVSRDSLTCTMQAAAGMEGQYRYMIRDKQIGGYLRGSTVQKLITIIPPLPVVTSAAGDCATQSAKCITGATLTLTGSNFNTRAPSDNVVVIGDTVEVNNMISCTVTESTQNTLTCTLRVDSSVPVGILPVYAQVVVSAERQLSPKALVGYLSIHGKATDKGWITATKSLSLFIVDSVAPAVLRDGANLTINGNFDATQQYHVEFSQEALPYAADSSFKGECNVVSVTSTAIVCMYKSSGNTKDVRCPLVYDAGNAYYLTMNCTAQTRVELYPAVPNVQGASGDCAKSSTACRNGASLTISGTGFNPSSAAANRVTLVGLASSSCDVVEVSASSLTCQLKVRPEDAGVYQLQVQTKVSDDEWSTPVSAGSIVLNGGAGVPGWSSGTVPLPSAKNTTTNNTAALACSIVFGVLFLALAVALTVICCRYTFVRRGTRNAQEPFWSTADASNSNGHGTPSPSKGSGQR